MISVSQINAEGEIDDIFQQVVAYLDKWVSGATSTAGGDTCWQRKPKEHGYIGAFLRGLSCLIYYPNRPNVRLFIMRS